MRIPLDPTDEVVAAVPFRGDVLIITRQGKFYLVVQEGDNVRPTVYVL